MFRSKDAQSQFKLPFNQRVSAWESMIGARKTSEIIKVKIYKQIETPEDGNDLDLSDC